MFMELKELCGEHLLCGVDRETKRVNESWGDNFEDCDSISFVLDGVVFTAVEDPSDGYRSSMRELLIGGDPVKFTFPPVRVVGRMRGDGEYHETNDVLELVDVLNGKTILCVGTENTDDYYPYFVAEWSPQNMACNSNGSDHRHQSGASVETKSNL
jgi:hypothetical protein